MSLVELLDMWEVVVAYQEEQLDFELQRTAWFTAHIMNSSGNYKKPIKPEKLYVSREKREQKKSRIGKKPTQDAVNREKEVLKQIFQIKD